MVDYEVIASYKTQKQTARVLKDAYLKFRCYLSFNNYGNELTFKTMQQWHAQCIKNFLKNHKTKPFNLIIKAVMKQTLQNKSIISKGELIKE